MAPCGLASLLRVWRLIIFTPSIIARLLLELTEMTLPRLPRSAPDSTTTSSPFFKCNFIQIFFVAALCERRHGKNHSRRQRDVFHELFKDLLAGAGSDLN